MAAAPRHPIWLQNTRKHGHKQQDNITTTAGAESAIAVTASDPVGLPRELLACHSIGHTKPLD